MSKAVLEQQGQEQRAPGWRINLFLLGGDFWEKLRSLSDHQPVSQNTFGVWEHRSPINIGSRTIIHLPESWIKSLFG